MASAELLSKPTSSLITGPFTAWGLTQLEHKLYGIYFHLHLAQQCSLQTLLLQSNRKVHGDSVKQEQM